MRLTAICTLCLLCFSVSAQDQSDNRIHIACAAATSQVEKCWSNVGNGSPSFLASHPEAGIPPDFAAQAHVGDPSPGGGSPIDVTLAASAISWPKTSLVAWSLHGKAE